MAFKGRIHSPPNFTKTLIWIHGLGDTADGFYSSFKDAGLQGWRIVLPTADDKAVTINGGAMMPSWYDIKSLELKNDLQPDMLESARFICQLIDEYDATVIGGFSQGAVIALLTALNVCEKQLAGVVAFSGYAVKFEPKR
jgi:phospholipase/carboxylesterase